MKKIRLRTTTIILTVLIVISQLLGNTATAFAADNTKGYSWKQISEGILGDKPAINVVSGESSFLSASEMADESNYRSGDIKLGQEESFWIRASIQNDNPKNSAVAKDVRIRISIDKNSSFQSVISATITSSNAEPYSLTDTLIFCAPEGFHLEYIPNTTYVYSWINGKQNKMRPGGQAVSNNGILVGYNQLDGSLPGGEYVYVYIGIKVVRDSEIEALRSTVKGKATVKKWNLLQNCANPDFFLNEYHKKMPQKIGVTFKGAKYTALANDAKKQTADCKTDYEKIKTICEYIANRTYYDYQYYHRITKKTNLTPYDVWKNKKTICAGYSALYWTMIDSLGIPCMILHGDNHAFNAAYDRASERWIIVDVTWCSDNDFTDDGKWEKGTYRESYFDMNLNFLLSIPNHEILDVEGVLTVSASSVAVSAGKKATVTAPKQLSLKVKSSDSKVATAKYSKSTGKISITGKKKGTATITVQYGSIIKTVGVNVESTTTKLSLSKTKVNLLKSGKTTTVKINATPKRSVTGEMPYVTCENSDIATAQYISKGDKVKIIAKKKGTTVITVKVGKKSKSIKVIVKK